MDRIEEALRHLELRIALAGDGWVDRSGESGFLEVSMALPGGALVNVDPYGQAALSKADGSRLGSGNLGDDRFYASFMHNCDAMIAHGFGKGAAGVIGFADAIMESNASEARDALLATVRLSDEPKPDVIDLFVVAAKPEVKAVADAADPDLRAAYHAWRGFATGVSFFSPAKWNDWDSLVSWNGRLARKARTEEPLPTANGYWTRIEDGCGLVEAARSLGMVEGQLGGYGGERSLYALRMVGYGDGARPMQIAAVAVFEEGDLVSVVKHADRERRPAGRIAADVAVVVEAVDRRASERDFESPRMFTV